METFLSYETTDYINDIVLWLIIIKLLRFDVVAKYLSFSFALIILPFAYLAMILSTLLFPFILLNFNDEQLGVIIGVLAPIVVIALVGVYRKKIIDLLHELRVNFKADSNGFGSNLAKDLNANSNLHELSKKYFEILKKDIDDHIFYAIPVFFILSYLIYSAYDYPHLIRLPAFGFVYGIEVDYWYSKWNLIWLFCAVGAITFFYSRYYLTAVLSPVYEKFNAICILISKNNERVVINRYFNLMVIDDNKIDEYYVVSDALNFIKSNGEIFFLFEKGINCRKFKLILNSLKIDGQRYFNNDFYIDFE